MEKFKKKVILGSIGFGIATGACNWHSTNISLS